VDEGVLPRGEHPSPLLRRPVTVLDGPWDFAVDGGPFERTIQVPYAPETPASGVGIARVERCTYRRREAVEPAGPGERLLVHLGAVDRVARVVANGEVVAVHEGGYTRFSADVTDAARDRELELVVEVADDPDDHEAPRGKQDWRDEPHAIWYPRTTGIWRSVWLERVAACHVEDVLWGCDLGAMTVQAEVRVVGAAGGASVGIALRHDDRLVAEGTARVAGGVARLSLAVGEGSIDDRWGLVWWPRRPVLLDAEIVVRDPEGAVVDRVRSYAALREVGVADGRFLVNGRDTFLRLALDQGCWPETGMTPPGPDALRHDLELARALGFNGVRKHQKVEDPRFLAAADELGMLVWVEMPSAYRAGTVSARRLLREWADVVVAHRGHPSVVAWVPVNESWGVPAIASDGRQRALAEAMAATARALDGSRPVSVNDGWETAGGDIVGVHDYTQDPAVLAERYADAAAIDRALTGSGVGGSGRRIDLDGRAAGGRAVVLSELGGISLAGDSGEWGYATAGSPADLLERYRAQWAAVHASTALAGACWTQLTDTYQEANGLLRMDRTPKADPDAISRATRGRG
jgi:hypothetical protein